MAISRSIIPFMSIRVLIWTAFFTAILFLTRTTPLMAQQYGAYGQYGQYGQYGAVPGVSILIKKQVARPFTHTKGGAIDFTNLQYADNLVQSDPRYAPSDIVYFRFTVKNPTAQTLNNVVLTDTVPQEVDPLEGPGNYDANTRLITVNVGHLNPNEEKTYYLKTQLVSQDRLPADKSIICPVNKVRAEANGTSDTSSSQFCVEKKVTGVTSVPTAGAELGPLLLGLEIIVAGAGIALKKLVS